MASLGRCVNQWSVGSKKRDSIIYTTFTHPIHCAPDCLLIFRISTVGEQRRLYRMHSRTGYSQPHILVSHAPTRVPLDNSSVERIGSLARLRVGRKGAKNLVGVGAAESLVSDRFVWGHRRSAAVSPREKSGDWRYRPIVLMRTSGIQKFLSGCFRVA